jgi:hypothetical protein
VLLTLVWCRGAKALSSSRARSSAGRRNAVAAKTKTKPLSRVEFQGMTPQQRAWTYPLVEGRRAAALAQSRAAFVHLIERRDGELPADLYTREEVEAAAAEVDGAGLEREGEEQQEEEEALAGEEAGAARAAEAWERRGDDEEEEEQLRAEDELAAAAMEMGGADAYTPFRRRH